MRSHQFQRHTQAFNLSILAKYGAVIDPLCLPKTKLQSVQGIAYSEQQVCHLALLLWSNFISNYIRFCWLQQMRTDAAVLCVTLQWFQMRVSVLIYHCIHLNITSKKHDYVGIKYFIALVGKCSHSSNEQQYKEKRMVHTETIQKTGVLPPFPRLFLSSGHQVIKNKITITNKIFFQSVSK